MGATIRAYTPADEPVLYEICLRTGASGQDATDMYRDPSLLGDIYVGPYVRFAPELAFVAGDDDGVGGYVLGVADTAWFDDVCARHWWPPLRARHPEPAPDDDSRDARLVRLMHAPPRTEDEVLARYPAHLHIDLLPRLQGRGMGRRLLTTLLDALADAGASGVHLGVGTANERAVAFYRRLGFAEIRRLPYALVMARDL